MSKDAKGKSASSAAQSAKKAAANKKGSKPKKKSWTKTKVKDKLNLACFIDSKLLERMEKELARNLLVTKAIISDKFKVNGSIARRVLREL